MPSWAPEDGSGSGTGSNTGGSRGSGTSGATGAAAAGQTGGRRGGLAIDFRRGKTSKERLQIQWVYPVWKPAGATTPQAGGTAAVELERALPAAEAYRLATDGDRRPLLVLRECDLCKGTDHALLSRTLDNEQTVLLTQWFRCIKLPTHVTDGKHPFFALFEKGQDGAAVPHLFFCDPDGGNRTPLPGDQSQGQLWATMYDFLERCYQGDAKKAIKELRSLLNKYDQLDKQEEDIRARMDREIEKKGAESDKLPKFEAELQKLQKERQELVEREQKLRALALRQLAEAPAAGDGADAGKDAGK